MKTLYIDIYFLINFTVDLISLHFAAMLSHTRAENKRLIISALLGGVCSCVCVLIDLPFVTLLLFISTVVFASVFCCKETSAKGRTVFGISLIILLSLVGGIVSFVWNLLDDAFSDFLIEGDVVNRKMLFFALIALLSIGVFKMLITVMNTGKIETRVEIEISFLGNACHTEALIDTGNLAIDPLSMNPVLIIKRDLAKKFIPEDIIDLRDVDSLDKRIKKRIRLIPLTKGGETHVYIGFLPDNVKLLQGGKIYSTNVTVAIDKEGGDFGGFFALMPYSAVKNAIN